MENKELCKAILAFQSEVGYITKTANNPFFKSKYADLSGIMEVIQPLLTKHGLIIVHSIQDSGVLTKLIHSDSEQFAGSCINIVGCDTMQQVGSAITYARRYNISSLLNLVTEDDDANIASKKSEQKHVSGGTGGGEKSNNPQVVEKVDRNNPQHQQKAFDILTELKHPDAPDLVKVVMARTHGKVTVTDLNQFIQDSYKV